MNHSAVAPSHIGLYTTKKGCFRCHRSKTAKIVTVKIRLAAEQLQILIIQIVIISRIIQQIEFCNCASKVLNWTLVCIFDIGVLIKHLCF
ncbi:hypothetical protein B0A75_11940 [Flavobacterium oncorhynchi]|uniref:Uncharacterized protein n=1 Tax=Flavobacterium oncorhynchi TaxID=728056 RepID=A0A226I0A4_9FLAO|nr:hypothetical protein B0A75_11940 [Flavobacterium oncorhynchi]